MRVSVSAIISSLGEPSGLSLEKMRASSDGKVGDGFDGAKHIAY